MLQVTCRACGKTYNYHSTETCPKCSAYNRPPHREVVEADGTVRTVGSGAASTRSRMSRAHGGQKVCYEKKECHEEAAREVRRETGTGAFNANAIKERVAGLRGRRPATGRQKAAAIVIAVIFLLAALVTQFVESRVTLTNNYYTPVAPAAEEYDVSEPLQVYHSIGETFTVERSDGIEEDITVEEARIEDGLITLRLSRVGEESRLSSWEPRAYWFDDDGYVYTQWMGTMEEDPESGLWSYTFDTTPYADADSGANEDGYYICFEEWLGSVLVQHLIPVAETL